MTMKAIQWEVYSPSQNKFSARGRVGNEVFFPLFLFSLLNISFWKRGRTETGNEAENRKMEKIFHKFGDEKERAKGR